MSTIIPNLSKVEEIDQMRRVTLFDKNGHRYIFSVSLGDEVAMAEELYRKTINPNSGITLFSVGLLTNLLGSEVRQAYIAILERENPPWSVSIK